MSTKTASELAALLNKSEAAAPQAIQPEDQFHLLVVTEAPREVMTSSGKQTVLKGIVVESTEPLTLGTVKTLWVKEKAKAFCPEGFLKTKRDEIVGSTTVYLPDRNDESKFVSFENPAATRTVEMIISARERRKLTLSTPDPEPEAMEPVLTEDEQAAKDEAEAKKREDALEVQAEIDATNAETEAAETEAAETEAATA